MGESKHVRRVYVCKRSGFDTEARGLLREVQTVLGIRSATGLSLWKRYDIQGIDDEALRRASALLLSEPNTDDLAYDALPAIEGRLLAVEALPGQFDQRADSAEKGLQLLTGVDVVRVRCADVYAFTGPLSEHEIATLKRYLINPIERREASMEMPETLDSDWPDAPDVARIEGFVRMDGAALKRMRSEWGLAMSDADLASCQRHFRDSAKRDPSAAEIRVLDTYWSDHCRHTTFLTSIDAIAIDDGAYAPAMKAALDRYRKNRPSDAKRPVCLMDIALAGMKQLKRDGLLDDLDESDEINACSIETSIDVTDATGTHAERWLVMFKNETHNHPTEIEPFGGAATCLGGAIRDPLSGRSYVYQAMRVTGSGDPRVSIEETLPGKLPQRKITTTAAAGFSSYGNQIGLQTGHVAEIYSEGYRAKRMEVGAVVGAAPKKNVRRETPQPGDVVLLLGGRTGRDGCGGATGSSKAHDASSLESCGAEVQKGNPPTERAIQRLFRNPDFTRLIKRCNDFGAGGVSVAIGELADGLAIDLDAVPKKYVGLDGTELAISESQERMACVVAAADAQAFVAMAAAENLEATAVATVSAEKRLVMRWRGQTIVDLDRAFLDTNGVEQHAKARISAPEERRFFASKPLSSGIRTALEACLSDLNRCSQRGLIERFDASIGANAVLNPFGGSHAASPIDAMAAKLPVLGAETDACTIMAHGYDPELSTWSPFHGAAYAITHALAKIAAAGGDALRARLSLQEYFERLGDDPKRWGKPLAALLGAYWVQTELGVPAIGGKDSMSGSFETLDVPPTLVAFALVVGDAKAVLSTDGQASGHDVALLACPRNADDLPAFGALKQNFAALKRWIDDGKVLSAKAVGSGGWLEAVAKMGFGNRVGFAACPGVPIEKAFAPDYGAIVVELAEGFTHPSLLLLGQTTTTPSLQIADETIPIAELAAAWEAPLESVFPTRSEDVGEAPTLGFYGRGKLLAMQGKAAAVRIARPRVVIPVFPGSNCEYDSASAFERAGAIAHTQIIRNLTPEALRESIAELAAAIRQAQIVMIPGGFSLGDEPDGSAKFIAAAFRSPEVASAVMELLDKRDGLMLGVCNGFQALIKLGLLPGGSIRPLASDDPTLTTNRIGRHVAQYVRTRVASTRSPWLAGVSLGDVHSVPVSHGEGRFMASEAQRNALAAAGQIAFQYCDANGQPRLDMPHNPNGSCWAVEGITSPDGRILGKMAHSERFGSEVGKNVPGEKDQKLFESGVAYFQ